MDAIPRPEDEAATAKLAKVERLEVLGQMGTIDKVVKLYNGAYNHDDVFLLSYTLVMNLILLNSEQSAYNARYEIIYKQLNAVRK